MGLNSLLLYINIMRYYVENFYLKNLNIINEYLKEQSKEQIILSNDGLYKYIDRQLYKFKIRNNKDDIIIKNNKNNIISTDVSWKKYDISYKIPFIFKKIEVLVYDFNIMPDVTFRVEKINNKISDYYFLSKYSYMDFFLKDGIISFLSLFNNINNI
jgi:hypothetical protein